jgi:hypothetical protein
MNFYRNDGIKNCIKNILSINFANYKNPLYLCCRSGHLLITPYDTHFNWQGMILEPLAYRIEQFCYTRRIPYQALKPLWSCPTCMSSFWGLVFYIALGHSYLSPAAMLMAALIAAFINTLFCILLNNITDEGC